MLLLYTSVHRRVNSSTVQEGGGKRANGQPPRGGIELIQTPRPISPRTATIGLCVSEKGSITVLPNFTEKYDVVVIGAGHAGCEAAMASARMGLKTALYTINLDLIAQMSCNPAVGGIAKGHLVREVDALGGVIGEVIDAVGIQFRLLNTSRGPAVWSPRAQADKKQYRVRMRQVLESEPNLRIKQAEVVDLVLEPFSPPDSRQGAGGAPVAGQRVRGIR